jgi:hypothetical protein
MRTKTALWGVALLVLGMQCQDGHLPRKNSRVVPVVGAIRWDAWYGNRGHAGRSVHKALGPKEWHSRLPFFGKVLSDSMVEMIGDSQAVVDQEIHYASDSGLDYWAFVYTGANSELNYALDKYRKSRDKNKINFTLILLGGSVGKGGLAAWPEKMNDYIAYFKDPNFQTVLNGRPLLYMFHAQPMVGEKGFSSWQEGKKAFAQLRETAMRAGHKNPYLVAMEWSHTFGRQLIDSLGFDAIGAYASSANDTAATYQKLAEHTERWWDQMRETGAQVVPLVSAGWDRRPRVIHPMPWETWQKPGEGYLLYYETPKPQELATHLQHAIQWSAKYPQAAEAQAVIIYAWNENDEGGWIVPTLSEKTGKLDAIKKILKP